MERVIAGPTAQAPAEKFTGEVWFDVVVSGIEPSRLKVWNVRFTPGSRTAWHSHVNGQTLHVTDGLGLVVTDDKVIVMRPGDTVWTPPGERHWHGAAPDRLMAHLAMWEAGDGVDTTWLEHVTDAEYAAAAGQITGGCC